MHSASMCSCISQNISVVPVRSCRAGDIFHDDENVPQRAAGPQGDPGVYQDAALRGRHLHHGAASGQTCMHEILPMGGSAGKKVFRMLRVLRCLRHCTAYCRCRSDSVFAPASSTPATDCLHVCLTCSVASSVPSPANSRQLHLGGPSSASASCALPSCRSFVKAKMCHARQGIYTAEVLLSAAIWSMWPACEGGSFWACRMHCCTLAERAALWQQSAQTLLQGAPE